VPTILAIETSTQVCSVAVLSEERCEAARSAAGLGHSELVLEMVDQVLQRAGFGLEKCAAVAFGAGPGSFTGLRIACSVAQGLAWGRDLPVVAVSTLAAMAEQCRCENIGNFSAGTRVLSAQDARMGEIYWSLLEWDGVGWTEVVGPSLSTPESLAAAADPIVAYGCGNAFGQFADHLAGMVGTVCAPDHPDAAAVAVLGRAQYAAGLAVPAAQAAPLYVRDRVAFTSAEREAASELGA